MANYQETLEQDVVNATVVGDNTIIAAPGAGKYLAIDFLLFVPSADTTITFKKGVTPFSGAMPLKASQVATIENAMKNEHGVLTCDDNQAFVINSTGGVLTGLIRYRIIGK